MSKPRRSSASSVSGSGFRALGSRAPRHHWPLPAIASCLFALAGLRYTIHNWHHPERPSPWALPLIAIAIVLGAWNRTRRWRA